MSPKLIGVKVNPEANGEKPSPLCKNIAIRLLPSPASLERVLQFKLLANWATYSVPLITPKPNAVLRAHLYTY
jgi:hypothetical protein